SPNLLLLETGAVENTPAEAMASAKYIARLIAEYINR
ncbi:MAG: stage II sporulation protein P, partial [Sarcina sp.]